MKIYRNAFFFIYWYMFADDLFTDGITLPTWRFFGCFFYNDFEYKYSPIETDGCLGFFEFLLIAGWWVSKTYNYFWIFICFYCDFVLYSIIRYSKGLSCMIFLDTSFIWGWCLYNLFLVYEALTVFILFYLM